MAYSPAPPGWVRVDCHLHTVASGDSVLRPEQLVERATECGIDVVCVTDHHETRAAQELARRSGIRVVVGEEIRTPHGEVLGLFLTERIPYVLEIDDVIGRIRAQGGLVCLPHPYDLLRSSLGAISEQLCADGLVDAVEVFNAKAQDPHVNRRASALARRHGLPGTAGSDAHDASGVGAAFVEMPDFDGPAAFLTALRSARVVGEFRAHSHRFPSDGSR